MFGSKGFMRNGAQIDGILIESDDHKVMVHDGGTGSYHARVRVTFEDGTAGEFDTKLHLRLSGLRGVGAVVPVRYDPANRSKIDVDEDEIRRRSDLFEKQQKDAFAAQPATLAGLIAPE